LRTRSIEFVVAQAVKAALIQPEVGRDFESVFCRFEIPHPVHTEVNDALAIAILPNDVPPSITMEQTVGLHEPLLGFISPGGLVVQLDHSALG
jgi:hypothetical protein